MHELGDDTVPSRECGGAQLLISDIDPQLLLVY
jgi:hypothetical protein